jgi:1-acyl-sn-glycerol-3-phosphate acyltransferase
MIYIANMNQKQTTQPDGEPFLKRFFLWLLVWAHVIRGVLTLLILFPSSKPSVKDAHIKSWSKRLLALFGVDLKINNPSIVPNSPYLLASNHISWIDIHVINAYKPIRFVAKSEVESWPIFGWMAKQLGTVFIERGSSRHAIQVVGNMINVLCTESICIFPEGTSTDGASVRPFKANLFESAVISHAPVYSLAIEYFDKKSGLRTDVTAFIGEMGLLESMSNILKHRNIRVELTFFPPSAASPGFSNDRKCLASNSHQQISSYLAF